MHSPLFWSLATIWASYAAFVVRKIALRLQCRHEIDNANPFDPAQTKRIKRWYKAFGGKSGERAQPGQPVFKLYHASHAYWDYLMHPTYCAQKICGLLSSGELSFIANESGGPLEMCNTALSPLRYIDVTYRAGLFESAAGLSYEVACNGITTALARDIALLAAQAEHDRAAFTRLVFIYSDQLVYTLRALAIPVPEKPASWNRLVARYYDYPKLSDFSGINPEVQPGELRLRAAAAVLAIDGVEALIVLAHCNQSQSKRDEVGASLSAHLSYVVVRWRKKQRNAITLQDSDDSPTPA